MAITIVERAESADTSALNDYPVGAYTPAANTIQVATVFMTGSDGTTVGTMDDSEGAWTIKRNDVVDTNRMGYIFWRKVGASPASITPTFHCTDQGTGCIISILEYDPDTMPSGDPIRQTGISSGSSTTNLTYTYGSALLTGNGYAAFITTANSFGLVTPPSGWTENADGQMLTPTVCYWVGSRAGGETGTAYTATVSVNDTYRTWHYEVWNEEPPSGGDSQLLFANNQA